MDAAQNSQPETPHAQAAPPAEAPTAPEKPEKGEEVEAAKTPDMSVSERASELEPDSEQVSEAEPFSDALDFLPQEPELPRGTLLEETLQDGPESAEDDAKRTHCRTREKRQKRSGLMIALRVLVIVWAVEMLYFIVAISNIPIIKKYRTIYIQTAMETMSHHWLATYFFPETIVAPIRDGMSNVQLNQTGIVSNIDDDDPSSPQATGASTPNTSRPSGKEPVVTDEEAFYDMFWELDQLSMQDYLQRNPDALKDGWENININEAGLDDSGTSIYTRFGEQVLAIDAKNQILLLRVEGNGYRGVLAVAKDASRLQLCPSSNIGYAGQYVGDIAANNNGVLGINGSGFADPGGNGNGGQIAGYAMCDGVEYGSHYSWGYKRIELHENNKFYITDAQNATSENATDAVEFTPALIVDGEVLVDETDFWNGFNPRACIGQSKDDEILMLVIEGRSVLSGIVGTGVVECANILARHNAAQAINLDGGSSAIMWYDGEYVNHCSNKTLAGRPLPNAWIYTGE